MLQRFFLKPEDLAQCSEGAVCLSSFFFLVGLLAALFSSNFDEVAQRGAFSG